MSDSQQARPVIAVVGPTGSGKSDLGVNIALALGGEVINADALQFYRGMDIGTAKISMEERKGVPHHLLDIMDVTQEASVADFQSECRAVIEDIHSRGKHAILVGGSGLYVRAALDILEFPGTDPALRRSLEDEYEAKGLAPLRARLEEVDPVSAARLGDARRVIRALEVHGLTGRAFSSFMPQREYYQPAVQIGLSVDREELRERLARRVHRMVETGLENEVARLDTLGLRQGKTASRALGYAQFLKVLDGDMDVPAAAEETIVATRQFARRQLTWFRADPRISWLDWKDPGLTSRAVSAILAQG
ncbi:tRNA (adenosine(37)-N6)-dimethylallyltransferase MiaA [Paenarthrobacter sp. Y-19]|jgi:tRNA dimethylallyltransferase|uniref:tRNA (adenosine(37)-N6)-dimethylallyltransferase MiaA n=1 Tax=unclassified Paenarthrobacter TaxID=2634190 RepID=UPI00057D95D2|nr:tRNA (adenosine(37)-N6)-dimethylallyltransferase MiaA [Paenarthrobacter sp. Y-19]KIA73746.1 tRNA dimethylallyltransferase MiaA [Arthrobacter sp. MWB30]BCW10246.1 tRNA dimethylallyltransferase [Arthrobacter sp. NtRootA2]BCW14326.1 tRNA dimethylallyltransferase [Arthrobacter sp. NtRootA4]BCW22662.1 tRNA dimethylallyltransferase [Arthrobacter sp. NtRootC7]BCW26931.1 tRNA dimethylallyltransferase [Arthrobacter sp. NtRootC45]BCW31201.1 tRNA dimethylallyltransferase [Arthrobacter sp. NtRootD5]